MRNKNLLTALVVVGAVGFDCQLAFAGSQNSNMTVSSAIAANCTISTPALAFGAYDPISANAVVDLTGQVAFTMTCTTGATTTIDLGQGVTPANGSSANVPLRQMVSGPDKLAYHLYTDVNRTVVWGAAAATRNYTGTGAADATVVCYGKIPAGQALPAGNYTDTVVATVNF